MFFFIHVLIVSLMKLPGSFFAGKENWKYSFPVQALQSKKSFHQYFLFAVFCFITILAQNIGFGQTMWPTDLSTDGTVNSSYLDKSTNTLYIGGAFTGIGTYTGRGAAINMSTGNPDPAFPIVEGTVNGATPDGTGGWYICGDFITIGGVSRVKTAHIKSDNTLDAVWAPVISATNVYAIAVCDSTVFIGGNFTDVNGVAKQSLAAVDKTSGTVRSWNLNLSSGGTIYALTTSGSRVYAGGIFSSIGGVSRTHLAAINGNTGAIISWSPNPGNLVRAIVVSESIIYVGGQFSSIGGQSRNMLAAIDSTTGTATSWNPDMNGTVYSLAISGSTVYAGGDFTFVGGQIKYFLCALDKATGSLRDWGLLPSHRVTAIAVSASTVFIGGEFTIVNDVKRGRLAAIDSATNTLSDWNPGANGKVNALAVPGSTVYAFGEFSLLKSVDRNRIAAIDLTTKSVTDWNPNISSTVSAIEISDEIVYAGGTFTSAGGLARNRICAIDRTTGTVTNWNPNANANVNSIAASGSTVYVGGMFTSIGGQSRSRIAALDATTGLATSWNPSANTLVQDLKVSGSTIYVGGNFATIGGQSRSRIAALDATTGLATSWNPGASGNVLTLAISDTLIYAGGNFISIGGQLRNRLAALSRNTGTATAWDPNASASVSAIALLRSTVYAGGTFTTMGGISHPNIAAIDAATGAPTSWNPISSATALNTIAAGDSLLYVGGNFTKIGGENRASSAGFSLPAPYSITATSNANGVISPSGITEVDNGGTMAYTISPNTGYHVASITIDGNAVSPALSYTFTNVTANHTIEVQFAINIYQLNISATNGTVSRDPNLEGYDSNFIVQLTAIPATGYRFTGWSGDASGMDNPLSVTMNGNKNVTASFTLVTYSLTSFAEHGSVLKNPDLAQYDSNSTVQLTAIPDQGYHFNWWSGDIPEGAMALHSAGNTGNPLTLIMDADKNVVAQFGINTYTLSVSATEGTISKSPDLPEYDTNSTVQITAAPNAGYYFTGWSGDVSGTDNPLTVTMNGNKTIIANFALITYTLNVTAENGSVTKNPSLFEYQSGSTVELTAEPGPGYHFTGWSGDASGTDNPLTITMDTDKNITANFALNTYTLSVSAVNGSVTKNPDLPSYDLNATVELTAIPSPGYHFTGWSGDASGTDNPLTVTMDTNKNITANFVLDAYTLSVSALNGSVSKNPNLASYSPNSTVALTATPAQGFVFSGWSGDVLSGSTSNPMTVIMTSNKNITANFTPVTKVVVNDNFEDGSTGNLSGENGAVIQVSQEKSKSGSYSIKFKGGAFAKVSNIIDPAMVLPNITNPGILSFWVSAETAGDIVVCWNDDPKDTVYSEDTSWVQFAVPINETGTGSIKFKYTSASTSYYFDDITLTDNLTLTSYALSLTSNGNGTVDANPSLDGYSEGSSVVVTAIPATGYHFTGWSGDTTGTGNPISISMYANKTITASFAINTYSLTVNATNGSVTKSPDQTEYDSNSVVQLTAVPATGYHFTGWSGGATGSDNPLSVTMNSNKMITANFAINSYTLTVNTTSGGTVTNDPELASYDSNTVVQLIVHPASGYHFEGWSGDTTGFTGSYLNFWITMNSNKAITATFAPNTFPLNVVISGNGSVTKNPDQALYDSNSVVQVTAIPDPQNHFTGWGGDASGTDNPLTVTMDASKNITANFAPTAYTLTITAVHGSVMKNPDQPTYSYGTPVQLTVFEDSGYHFTGWSGDLSGSNTTMVVLMTTNKNITANFAADSSGGGGGGGGGSDTGKFTLTTNATYGYIEKNPSRLNYDSLAIVQLTAHPDHGYVFTGWSGDATGMDNPLTIIMNGNKTVTATFEQDPQQFTYFRTASYEDWAKSADAKGKRVAAKRKADKVFFKFNLIADSTKILSLDFGGIAKGAITRGQQKLDTLAVFNNVKKLKDTLEVSAGDTIQVDGIAQLGKKTRVKYAWGPKGKAVTMKADSLYKMNRLGLPMPNLVNVGEELFPRGFSQLDAYFKNGLIIGKPQGIRGAKSVAHKKYSDVLLSLGKQAKINRRDTILMHTGAIRCLDSLGKKAFEKQQKGLSPSVMSNKLFGEALALKLNIAASATGKFPTGFGEILFGDSGSEFYNLTLNDISALGDSLLSCLPLASHPTLTMSDFYEVASMVNSIFAGSIDTISFAAKTQLKGVRRIVDLGGGGGQLLAPKILPVPVFNNDVTDVGDVMPAEFSLSQNYPNPFNPSTAIRYSLSTNGIVTLKVFNMLGQEVVTLLNNEEMEEGEYESSFNAANFASGVYFYKITIESVDGEGLKQSFTDVKRMLMLK